jgi:hypothetical protein
MIHATYLLGLKSYGQMLKSLAWEDGKYTTT